MSLADPLRRPRVLLAAMAVASVAAVGAALVSQHVFGIEPCPWCILQRVLFLAVAAVCVVALALPGVLRQIGAGTALLLALCGAASALWQHFVAARSASCNLTLADRVVEALRLEPLWPDVFSARASCAEAAVKLLGVPYEFWSLALFVLLAVAAWRGAQRPSRRIFNRSASARG